MKNKLKKDEEMHEEIRWNNNDNNNNKKGVRRLHLPDWSLPDDPIQALTAEGRLEPSILKISINVNRAKQANAESTPYNLQL